MNYKNTDKDIFARVRHFYLEQFQEEDVLMSSVPLNELRLLESYGKSMLSDITAMIDSKDFSKMCLIKGINEEEIYSNKSSIILNLETVMKCIGHHEKKDVMFYNDLNFDLRVFEYFKN